VQGKYSDTALRSVLRSDNIGEEEKVEIMERLMEVGADINVLDYGELQKLEKLRAMSSNRSAQVEH
jgi:hypothetical protein